MRNFIPLLILLMMASCQNNPQNNSSAQNSEVPQALRFFVGTYTDSGSEGIYAYQLHPDGSIDSVGLAAFAENPSFLVWSRDKQFLVSVNELDQDGSGFVTSFRRQGNSLLELSKQQSGGAHPCFVSVNSDGFVLVANYTGGNVGLLKLRSDGMLSGLLDVQQHFGAGTTDRQQGPHAHSAWFVPGSDKIISVDLGTNSLWFSQLDKINERFDTLRQEQLLFADGAGPRHLAFHPGGKWTYVLNELNNTVALLQTDSAGDEAIKETYATLPVDFSGQNTAADIHISADGKFLYSSNRGHNSIAIFGVDEQSGGLKLLGFQPVHGDWPRNFSFSPDEQFLLVANQYSSNIVTFRRDITTGLLTFVSSVDAPQPVCILF